MLGWIGSAWVGSRVVAGLDGVDWGRVWWEAGQCIPKQGSSDHCTPPKSLSAISCLAVRRSAPAVICHRSDAHPIPSRYRLISCSSAKPMRSSIGVRLPSDAWAQLAHSKVIPNPIPPHCTPHIHHPYPTPRALPPAALCGLRLLCVCVSKTNLLLDLPPTRYVLVSCHAI